MEENFIRVYEDAIPEDLINDLIIHSDEPSNIHCLYRHPDTPSSDVRYNYIQEEYAFGRGEGQMERLGRLGREDEQKYLNYTAPDLRDSVYQFIDPFFQKYAARFIHPDQPIDSKSMKVQKTPIHGSYSAWHYEISKGEGTIGRVISWILYLNDVEDGGETEFMWQGIKQKPKKGDLVIFPASYTHLHRGNPPYSNDKYIITGWGEFL